MSNGLKRKLPNLLLASASLLADVNPNSKHFPHIQSRLNRVREVIIVTRRSIPRSGSLVVA